MGSARVCTSVQSLLTAVQSLSLCEIHQLYSKPCLNTHSLTNVVHRPSSYLDQAVLTKSKVIQWQALSSGSRERSLLATKNWLGYQGQNFILH